MRIPACVPRLPPGLLSAWALQYATYRYMKRQKKREQRRKDRAKKKKTITGKIAGAPIYLILPEAESRPKYDCKICITSGKRRAIIEMMPGKTSKHDPIPARQLAKAIHNHCHGTGGLPFRKYRTWKYIVELVRNMGERGLIHHLTEDLNEYTKRGFFPFKARWCVPPGIYPFADLRLSNWIAGDMYYPIPGDFLPIEPALKLLPEAQMTWGKEVFIERPVKKPGVVRICPVLAYDAAPVVRQRRTNGSTNTTFHFGTTTQTGDTRLPIEIPILELANRTHMYGVGQTGCGKTNLWKGLAQDAADMMDNGIVSMTWFFDPVKRAQGLEHFEAVNFKLVTDAETTQQAIEQIRDAILKRKQLISGLNKKRIARNQKPINQWPIGQTIDGDFFTAKLILVDEIQGFRKEFIEEHFVPWTQQLRSLGFVIIMMGQDFRANVNIPTALLKNVDARLCMYVRDDTIGYDFFKAGKEYKWSREPTRLKRGEFIIDLPWRDLGLQYGITKHIPDEDAQAA